MLATLSSALAEAVRQRRIITNPAAGFKIEAPQQDRAITIPWNLTQIRQWLDFLEASDDSFAELFTVSTTTECAAAR